MDSFDGKAAIVTGGASGIGRALAEEPGSSVAHLLWWLNRFSPALFSWVSKRYLREIEKACL